MMLKNILLLLSLCQSSLSTPIPQRFIPVVVENGATLIQTRDPIGDWIQSSEWFPIQVNIPDLIANIGQGFQNGWNNIGNGLGGIIQQIPFINRITSQFTPRPNRFYVLMPLNNNGVNTKSSNLQASGNFNPFQNSVSQFIPAYP